MFAALAHGRYGTNQWMFLHQSAYLDQNQYRGGYLCQMHQEENIRYMEEMYGNTHIRPANR
jgi:hypothetical protein